MFIPQVDELDTFDSNGQQAEDVNSLIDLVHVHLLPNKNRHHNKDSDDDNARYFHAARIGHSFYQPFFSILKAEYWSACTNYPQPAASKLSSVFSEIQSPPPKA
jgi:hypothetical protein